MAAGAIIGAAIIAAGATIYSSNKQMDAAEDQWRYSNTQQAQAATAEADSIMKQAQAEASSLQKQAAAQAQAYIAQGTSERDALYAAADEARTVAYANIEKLQAEADESLRQLDAEQTSYEAKARAKAAASGVRLADGSTGLYLTNLEEENDTQYSWLQSSYQSGIDVTKKTAEQEYNATKNQANVAYQAGQIQAKAALESGSALATAAKESGIYSANALRAKANSYLAAIGGSSSRGKTVQTNRYNSDPYGK